MFIPCFSGEGEILQLPSRNSGRNNAYFRKPAVPTSVDSLSHVNGINVTSLRPRFSSKGTTYRVKIGSSVTMSCEIINLGNYISRAKIQKIQFFLNYYWFGTMFLTISEAITYPIVSGSSVIVWKQTHRIISAGSRLIRKDSRMKLVRTNTGGIGLKIDNVSQDDRG